MLATGHQICNNHTMDKVIRNKIRFNMKRKPESVTGSRTGNFRVVQKHSTAYFAMNLYTLTKINQQPISLITNHQLQFLKASTVFELVILILNYLQLDQLWLMVQSWFHFQMFKFYSIEVMLFRWENQSLTLNRSSLLPRVMSSQKLIGSIISFDSLTLKDQGAILLDKVCIKIG